MTKYKNAYTEVYEILEQLDEEEYNKIPSEVIKAIEENRNIVLNWLKINQIHYDNIIFSPEDKLEICKQNNIDLMIEDKPKNINTISNEIPVICYHANYNEQCNGKNIYRCYSWYDIYRKRGKR